jgi:tetratricopeptide (TPR) repeat protein
MRTFAWTALVLLAGGCSSSMPEHVRTYNDDGLYLFQRGDYRQARDTFQAALELAPNDLTLRYNLAQSCEKLGDAGKAEKLYQECLGRDANNVECRYALCALLVRQGRREEATRMVEDWLAREPARGDAYALDGWLWHETGDLPRAQSRLQQAVQFDPGNVKALTELGLVYESLRRPDRALALYERSLQREPDQPAVIERVDRLKAQGVSYPHPE